MKFSKNIFLLLVTSLVFVFSCTENQYVYEVNEVTVVPNNSEKDKEKSPEQFVSVLYANIYQQALSPDQLVDMTEAITSVGDKQVAYETLIAKFMKDPNVQVPSNSEMRNDVETFVTDTYKRFLVRLPTEIEKTYFVNYINSHPNVTPEHIYVSFATSNEYYFY